jgi:hypothetical protein
MKTKKRGRPRRRQLRGPVLVRAAHAALAKMTQLSPKTDPVNIASLSRHLGVTRQALYHNKLKTVVDEYAKLQRTNFSTRVKAVSLRRPLEQRIAELQQKNLELQQAIDGWIERWAAVEYNARMHGYDADLLFAPIPPPARKTLAFRKGRKKR